LIFESITQDKNEASQRDYSSSSWLTVRKKERTTGCQPVAMSVESLREEIAAKRTELTEIQAKSKATERELLDRKNELASRKAELMDGVQGRMDPIDMLQKDIVWMANEEYAHITQHEFEYPLPPLIS
jgi:DNA repair exonuclease SbcCD ATPase subunit